MYDITHKIAILYKQCLKDDLQWEKFAKKCSDFKKQVQLTEYFTLAPPNQRSKARYHNIDVLVDWGVDKLIKYDTLSGKEKDKLKWLQEFCNDLQYWNQLVEAGRITRDLIRKKGFWNGCEEELSDRLLNQMTLCSRGEEFSCKL